MVDKNSANSSATTPSDDRAVVITRIVDAPREVAFKAWIDPDLMRQWSAPHGFTITHGEAEVRPDGVWRCCMHSSAGADLWLGGIYREVVPPKRLVFTHAWEDDVGTPGQETLVTVSFEDHDGKTLLSFRQEGFESRESRDGHEEGWKQCFDRLAEALARV